MDTLQTDCALPLPTLRWHNTSSWNGRAFLGNRVKYAVIPTIKSFFQLCFVNSAVCCLALVSFTAGLSKLLASRCSRKRGWWRAHKSTVAGCKTKTTSWKMVKCSAELQWWVGRQLVCRETPLTLQSIPFLESIFGTPFGPLKRAGVCEPSRHTYVHTWVPKYPNNKRYMSFRSVFYRSPGCQV